MEKPAMQYYQQRLDQEMNIDKQAVDSIAFFPLFDTVELQHFKTELPNHIAACEDVDASHGVCTLWKNDESMLPHWSAAACKVAVARLLSAAAEKVFSVLN